MEKRRRRRAAAAAAQVAALEAAAPFDAPAAESMLPPQLSMRESMSSTSDSQEGDMDISQEPTGVYHTSLHLTWYVTWLYVEMQGSQAQQLT